MLIYEVVGKPPGNLPYLGDNKRNADKTEFLTKVT